MVPNITAGETILYYESYTDPREDGGVFDPSTDTLVYDCLTDGSAQTITATDNGDGRFKILVAYGTTDGWQPGTWNYQAHVTDSAGIRTFVESGTFEVKHKFADMNSGYDNRTHAKKALDAIEAVLEGKATQDQMSYSIAGRSLSRFSWAELMKARQDYKTEYAREQSAEKINAGLGGGATIKVRMPA